METVIVTITHDLLFFDVRSIGKGQLLIYRNSFYHSKVNNLATGLAYIMGVFVHFKEEINESDLNDVEVIFNKEA